MERLRPAPPRAEVLARAEHDGIALVVDGLAVRDKASALAAVATAARFPDWFGHNLDALADSLGDLSWLPTGTVTLVWPHADRLWLLPARDRDGILAVLDEVDGVLADGRALRIWLLDAPAGPGSDRR